MPARFLIVDDEPKVLDLLKRYLLRLGYHVDTALDAEAALALFSAAPKSYDLVVTDLTLPGKNGEDLLKEVRRLNPSIPALISSGYVHKTSLENVAFLQKPFTPHMLLKEIQRLLS